MFKGECFWIRLRTDKLGEDLSGDIFGMFQFFLKDFLYSFYVYIYLYGYKYVLSDGRVSPRQSKKFENPRKKSAAKPRISISDMPHSLVLVCLCSFRFISE